MEASLRRGMYILKKLETPATLIQFWSVVGSWHSQDVPLIENDHPWYNINL